MPQYWLMKSEPDELSIRDLQRLGQARWDGVRNYQARNFVRAMQPGDLFFFYHSSCPQPGIAGLAEVASGTRTDPTQFDAESPYFDAKSAPDKPRWLLLDVAATRKTRLISLDELRQQPALADMVVLKRGNRLSITPVTLAEWDCIVQLMDAA